MISALNPFQSTRRSVTRWGWLIVLILGVWPALAQEISGDDRPLAADSVEPANTAEPTDGQPPAEPSTTEPLISEAIPTDQEQESDDPDLSGSLSRTLSFGRDREMEARLRKAMQAIAAGSPVTGVQILAEVFALQSPHIIQVGSTYRDVREEAARQLRLATDQIREQFRRDTEPRARSEFRAALAEADMAKLAQIAARYPQTPVAQECVETLVAQLNDHGRYDGVVHSVSRWIYGSPTPHQAALACPQLIDSWILSLVQVGLPNEAAEVAARYGRPTPEGILPRPEAPLAVTPLPHAVDPGLDLPWSIESPLPNEANLLIRGVLNDLARQGVQPTLVSTPLILSDRILWRSLTEIVCVHKATGRILWRQHIHDPLIEDVEQLGQRPDPNLLRRIRMQLGHRLLRDTIYRQLTHDDESVYAVQLRPEQSVPQQPVSAPPGNNTPDNDFTSVPQQSIVAYSIEDGSVKWRSDEVWSKELQPTPQMSSYFFGPPVPQGDHLYAVIQNGDQLLLAKLNAKTGAFVGASVLGEGPKLELDKRRLSQASPLVWYRGMAICATGAGAVVAFDLFAGEFRWGYRHARDDVETPRGLLQPPVDKHGWTWMNGWVSPQLVLLGDRLVYASPETRTLRCLAAGDGELHWDRPIEGAHTIIGGDSQRVIVVGVDWIRSIAMEDGRIEQEHHLDDRLVSAIWDHGVCQLYFHDGHQIEWAPDTGVSRIRSASEDPLVQLAPAGTKRPIEGPAEQSLQRIEWVDQLQLVVSLSRMSLQPVGDTVRSPRDNGRNGLPASLAFQPNVSPEWITSLAEWVVSTPDPDRETRAQVATTELIRAIQQGYVIPSDLRSLEAQWGLTADQSRELQWCQLTQRMNSDSPGDSLPNILRLLELTPQAWEIESSALLHQEQRLNRRAVSARTVRLDAALCGAIQEIWDYSTEAERTQLSEMINHWRSLPQTQLDRSDRHLEPLYGLSLSAIQRPFEWKTLGELAQQHLELHRQATQSRTSQAVPALWRLFQFHMERGDWSDAARLVEQLQQRFSTVTVQGSQTAADLIKSLPEDSPVLKRVNRDRRTAWPERPMRVIHRESRYSEESIVPIPIQAEQGSLFDQLNVTRSRIGQSQLTFAGLGQEKSWKLTLPASSRLMRQAYPELWKGWAFGQFLVVQSGSELFFVSSLNSKGEMKASRKEMILWPVAKDKFNYAMIDTLGNEENALLSHENRPVPQQIGFYRPQHEQFDAYGHRAAWVGPVGAGTVCFLQQGMLVCLDTASGQERWRRYNMPAGVRTVGDDEAIVIVHDREFSTETLSPLDGRTIGQVALDFAPTEILRHYGRTALVGTGLPDRHRLIEGENPTVVLRRSDSEKAAQACELRMVDLVTSQTIWSRTDPPGTFAFEIDHDWVGVMSPTGMLQFLDVRSGDQVSQTQVDRPADLSQIAVAVTERSVLVSLSGPVTETALVNATRAPLRWRHVYANGPLHAFDRRSGTYQWTRSIKNRIFPLDQPRDVPIVLCVDRWKGPYPAPEVPAPNLEGEPSTGPEPEPSSEPESDRPEKSVSRIDAEAMHSRFWCLDARSGEVLLDAAIPKSSPDYSIERSLSKGWIDLRLGFPHGDYRFEFTPDENLQQNK